MFAETTLLGLFPTNVWVHDLPASDCKTLNDNLQQCVDAILGPRAERSHGQSWQTAQQLHTLPQLGPLTERIVTAATGVLDFLQIDYESFAITGCWANVSMPGAAHKGHIHPNNFLSGVYYVRAPSGGDSIVFHDPRPQTNVIAPRVRTQTEANSITARIPVQEGRLLLFPSWFGHSVPANNGDGERVSIAFNIMFSRFAETMASPKWTPDDGPHEDAAGE